MAEDKAQNIETEPMSRSEQFAQGRFYENARQRTTRRRHEKHSHWNAPGNAPGRGWEAEPPGAPIEEWRGSSWQEGEQRYEDPYYPREPNYPSDPNYRPPSRDPYYRSGYTSSMRDGPQGRHWREEPFPETGPYGGAWRPAYERQPPYRGERYAQSEPVEQVRRSTAPYRRERSQRYESGRHGGWEHDPYTAGEIMTRDVKTVTCHAPIEEAARIMKDENCGIVPIIDETQKLIGVVTDRDMVMRTLAKGRSMAGATVADVMTEDVEAATPEEPLSDVVELMGEKQIRRVPVVDRDDRLLGIVSMADIANRAERDEELKEALKMISARRSFWSRLWK